MKPGEAEALASAVREACIREARAAWEDAGLSGLCGEGRWEVVVGALRGADLEGVVRSSVEPTSASGGAERGDRIAGS